MNAELLTFLGEPMDDRQGRTDIRIGQIVSILSNGQALVDFPGNSGGPVEARSVVHLSRSTPPDTLVGASVLLIFENHDPSLPIIAGLVRDALYAKVPEQQRATKSPTVTEVLVDGGKRIEIRGDEELVLRCGKSSLTLRKDGKILVKGRDVISCATHRQRIKGGSVAIN